METNLVKEVIKKTLFWDLDSLVPQEDGTYKHIHSSRFLAEHPERKNSPEFTEEEELEVAKFLAAAVKLFK